MIKILIIILIIIGLFIYLIVHVSAGSVDDEMQKKLDEEQAQIIANMSKKDRDS